MEKGAEPGDQNTCYWVVYPRCERKNTSKALNSGCLNKTGIMTTPVDMPMGTEENSTRFQV